MNHYKYIDEVFHTESNRSSRVAMQLLGIDISFFCCRYMTFVVGQNDHVRARSDKLYYYTSHFCIAICDTHIFFVPLAVATVLYICSLRYKYNAV